jgi:hypothetical protein
VADQGSLPLKLSYLVRAVGRAALILVIGAATSLAFSTVESWYPGTGAGTRGPTETTVLATVESCQRVGPVSHHGFGYWWECEISVPGGIDATVDRSILTASDVGREVELQRACYGDDRCFYGRRISWLWTTAFLGLRIVDRLVSLFFLGWALIWLARGVLGPERFQALLARRRRSG